MAKTYDVKPCPGCGKEIRTRYKQCSSCAGKNRPEDRDRHPLCGAKTRAGKPCRRYAGQGTLHPGVGRCAMHLGKSPSHNTAAVALAATQRMVTLGTPVENITAPEALMGLLRSSAGHVAWIQQEVAALDDLSTHEAQVLVKLYDSERSMLVRVSEAAIRAGVAEHIVRMETAKATLVIAAVRDAARDAGLTPAQVQALGVAIRKRLAEADGEDLPDADARLAELRSRIAADEEARVSSIAERRAQQLSGLTFPPAEMVPDEPTPAA